MRIVLPPSAAPLSRWRDRLPRLTWRSAGLLCAGLLFAAWLGLTAVSDNEPRSARVFLPLAHPVPGATDWPGWRGPSQQGIAQQPGALLQWSPSQPFAWQTPLPGAGQSSPCVWGDSVYVSAEIPRKSAVALLCVDRESGRFRWQTELVRLTHAADSADAIPTPACDGQLIFVPIVEAGRVCLCAVDRAGTLRWKRDAGPFASANGYRSSPVVSGSLVYVAVDQSGRWRPSSRLLAFHRQTGEIAWRAQRPNGDSGGVPVVAELAGRRQLVLAGKHAITSYHPDTGAVLWTCRWSASRVSGSVAFDADCVFVTARHPQAETVCIRADGDGDVTETHMVWRERRAGSDGPSPTLVGSALLLFEPQGLLTALDKTTGRVLWHRSLSGEFDAAPVVRGRYVYCLNRDGTAFVIDVDRRGEVLVEAALGRPGSAAAAFSGDRLILRCEHDLLAIAPSTGDAYAAEPSASPRKY